MKTELKPSISKNLIVSLVLVLTVVITCSVITHCVISSINEKKVLEQKADDLLENLKKSIEFPLWNFDMESLNKIIDAYFVSDLVSEIVVMRENRQNIIVQKVELYDDSDFIVKNAEVLHNEYVIGYVRIGLTKRFLRESLEKLIVAYFITAIVMICIVVGLTGVLLRIFLKKPFKDLSFAMKRISAGDYSCDLTNIRQKEFSLIVDKFTKMADQIQQREESLSRAKNYISDIFNTIDSILVGVDAFGNITHWNKNAEQFAGLTMETMETMENAMGQKFKNIFPLFESNAVMLKTAMDTNTSQMDLKVPVTLESGKRYYSIAVFPLSFEGDKGAVIRINDVSEKVRLEEMMIQTEKMLSVGGLAAGMAHEINNPLAGMLQNAQVIENRLSLADMPVNVNAAAEYGITMDSIKGYMEQRGVFKLLSSLREAGNRAAKIVDNMLSFSRKSGSGFICSDLREMVDNTLELAANDYDLKKNYDFKSIEIKKEYSDNMPGVYCDVSKIQQVVLNILKNGAHAMYKNDNQAELPRFILRIKQRKGEGIIEIEDNGPGMEENIRKRVFEPFFTTKSVGVGTGLGLSVSYFIVVENHKGTITVKSEKGRGTNFIIHLPENIKA
ncbi:MAG: ATP-binding protein [Thermodesulfobacteriota bacterium]|nr:ATP-binding protein [Thermodesulfobacteriota bacterium]